MILKAKIVKKITVFLILTLFTSGVFVMPTSASEMDGTIDSTYKYAWGENIGWINFGTNNGNVHVTDSGLSGYALSETAGWINLNNVINDGEGNLSGNAWGENVGYIKFNPTNGGVNINSSGDFNGSALGENIGWIIFSGDYKVKTDWRPQSARICTSWIFSAWSSCSAGQQTRTIISSSPNGCYGGNPILSQSCSSGGGGLPTDAYVNPKSSINKGQIIINSGDETTVSQKIKITLNYSSFTPNITGYALSNDPIFQSSSIDKIKDYEKSGREWDLCSGKNSCPDGQYIVYVKFYTEWGRASEVFRGTIKLVTKKDTPTPKTEPDLKCQVPIYLTNSIKFGSDNDPGDVKLLEVFLNTHEGYNLPIDGIYSTEDRNAVIKWQEKYADEILKPWGLSKGTGYIYTSSLKKIKEVYESLCKDKDKKPSSEKYVFTRNLSSGMTGDDVKELQKYLNNNGFILVSEGPGSPGNETKEFGALTRRALIKFQQANNISPAVGYFGSITRNFIINK